MAGRADGRPGGDAVFQAAYPDEHRGENRAGYPRQDDGGDGEGRNAAGLLRKVDRYRRRHRLRQERRRHLLRNAEDFAQQPHARHRRRAADDAGADDGDGVRAERVPLPVDLERERHRRGDDEHRDEGPAAPVLLQGQRGELYDAAHNGRGDEQRVRQRGAQPRADQAADTVGGDTEDETEVGVGENRVVHCFHPFFFAVSFCSRHTVPYAAKKVAAALSTQTARSRNSTGRATPAVSMISTAEGRKKNAMFASRNCAAPPSLSSVIRPVRSAARRSSMPRTLDGSGADSSAMRRCPA